MTGFSPVALLRETQPAALAGRAINAAAELARDAHNATRGKSFSDLIDGLDANHDGQFGLDDAVGLAGRGAANAISALTGVEISTANVASQGDGIERAVDQLANAALPPPPQSPISQPSQLPSPPPPPPPTVDGIHQLYAELRTMRS